MKYTGHAFHESLDKGRISGKLEVTTNYIKFITNEQELHRIDFTKVKIEFGGNNNHLLFFNDTTSSWSFATTNKEILQDDNIKYNHSLRDTLQEFHKKKNKHRLLITGIILLIILSLGLIYFGKSYVVDKIADQVPVSVEKSLGESAFKSYTENLSVIKNKQLNDKLQKLINPLLDVSKQDRFEYKFHIIQDEQLNAAAFPGGNIIINSGLILSLNNAEELLAVIAHEIAHVNQRHSIKALINNIGIGSILGIFTGGIDIFVLSGYKLLSWKNSRKAETEADEIGWQYLIDAKINPKGLIDSFKILKEKTPDVSENLDFISTHPHLNKRIKYLTEKWNKLPKEYKNLKIDPIEYKEIKDILNKVLNNNTVKKMKNSINGKPSFAHISVTLSPGESVTAQADAMSSMDAEITMKTHFNGGFFGAITKCIFGKESLFCNTFINNSNKDLSVVLVQGTPGDIEEIKLTDNEYCFQPGAYVASTPNVKFKVRWAGFASWIGGEGLFKLKVSGNGSVWYGSYGGLVEIDVDGEYIVDTGHLVAYEPQLKLKVKMSGGIFSSFFSGEGVVTKVIGKGKIVIQTRNISALASWINPKLP